MHIGEKEIVFAGHSFTLTTQRAVFWREQACLILADIHVGKAAHFRRHGVAIPAAISSVDLKRLEELITYYDAKRVIIVGDLLHAGTNSEVEEFGSLTKKMDHTEFILVKGNHDRISAVQWRKLGLSSVVDVLELEGLLFTHAPMVKDRPIICGHIHPGVRMKLPPKKVVSLPCYKVSLSQLILPAFSLFTGLDTRNLLKDGVCHAFYQREFFTIP